MRNTFRGIKKDSDQLNKQDKDVLEWLTSTYPEDIRFKVEVYAKYGQKKGVQEV